MVVSGGTATTHPDRHATHAKQEPKGQNGNGARLDRERTASTSKSAEFRKGGLEKRRKKISRTRIATAQKSGKYGGTRNGKKSGELEWDQGKRPK